MREILIDWLVLENFKCHRFLRLDFGGRSACLYGDNGAGKTSVYDGLIWLLFGKDSRGNSEKVIDIKPLDETGAVKDRLGVTAVEAGLLVDGEPLTLRRTLRENWVVRRGYREEVYEGNVSEFFVDGVPLKKSAYDAAVRQLVPEELFRMLTSVSCFAADLKWQERRSILFDMVGQCSDRELMESAPRFRPLLEEMGEMTPAECRTKLLSRKKGLAGQREDIPARLQECRRMLQEWEDADFGAAEQEEQRLAGEAEAISARLLALERDTALDALRLEQRQRKLEKEEWLGKNRAYRESQGGADRHRREALEEMERRCRRELQRYDRQLQENRQQWVEVNGQAFAGGCCPTCGQALPFDQLKERAKAFAEKKAQQLKALEERGKALEQERTQSAAGLEALCRELEQCCSREEPVDLEGFREAMEGFDRQLDSLAQQIRQLEAGSRDLRLQLQGQKEDTLTRLGQVRKLLARQELGNSTRQRIAQLEQEAENTRLELEKVENLLFFLEEFQRFKAEKMEKNVNDRFRLASFRLFREQANGGLEERCDVQFGGVRYPGLNNGARVNVGIDIINTLSRHYGVRVPLFVDNAEAVTKLERCDSQVIRLAVREGSWQVAVDSGGMWRAEGKVQRA